MAYFRLTIISRLQVPAGAGAVGSPEPELPGIRPSLVSSISNLLWLLAASFVYIACLYYKVDRRGQR